MKEEEKEILLNVGKTSTNDFLFFFLYFMQQQWPGSRQRVYNRGTRRRGEGEIKERRSE